MEPSRAVLVMRGSERSGGSDIVNNNYNKMKRDPLESHRLKDYSDMPQYMI